MEIKTTWEKIKTTVMDIQIHDIGPSEIEMRKDWMITEILELMAEKKIQKTNHSIYKEQENPEKMQRC